VKLTVRVLGQTVLEVELGPRLPEPAPAPAAEYPPASAHRHSGDFSFGFGTAPDRSRWLPSDVESATRARLLEAVTP